MTIGSFLAGIMTPWTQRPQTPSPADAFYDAQDKMAADDLARQKLAEEKRKNLTNEEITRSHVEGTNKYYETQAQTHKEDAEMRHQDKLEKDFAIAHQAMMKAKTPEERKLAIEALSRAGGALGYTAGEEPSGAPGMPAAPGEAGPAAPPSDHGVEKYAAYMEGRQREPKFQDFLDQMGKETGLGPPPMPWQGLGAAPGAGASSQEAGGASAGGAIAPPKPTGPMKFVLRDKNGASVYEWDEPLLHHQNQQALEQSAAAAMGGALTAEEGKAIKAAATEVAPFLDKLTAKEAMDEMAKRVSASLGQFKKHVPGGGGGAGSGVPGKDEQKRLFQLENVSKGIITGEANRNKLSAIASQEEAIDQGEQLLNGGGGFQQTSAMLEWLKGLAGRAPQSEFNALKSQQSVWGRVEQEINKLAPGAPLSHEIVRQMREAFAKTRETLRKFRNEIAEAGAAEVDASIAPFKPEERKAQHERVRQALAHEHGGGGESPDADERKKKALEAARKVLGQ